MPTVDEPRAANRRGDGHGTGASVRPDGHLMISILRRSMDIATARMTTKPRMIC
jgi:hypothetical protein